MSYALVDEAFIDRLEAEREDWLLLQPHPDFTGHWLVESFDRDFFFNLKDVIGPYRAVSPASLEDFLAAATGCDYKVAWFEDPTSILDDYSGLNEPPPFEIVSDFEGTINGMLPFQLQGFNMLKDLDAGVLRWDTGTGKTVAATGMVKYHQQKDNFDLCLFVVKKNNKINTQRKLERLAGVESERIRGPRRQRDRLWRDIAGRLLRGERGIVVVLNYENFLDFIDFTDDGPELTGIGLTLSQLDLLCMWDEMPTKLKTRTTRLYAAIVTFLYSTANPPKLFWKDRRPTRLVQYMLSATPIENDPEDWFNCIRILTGGRVYGTATNFHNQYVTRYNYLSGKPESWANLDRMYLETAHMTHQVDKTDPDIAKVFPTVVKEPFYIDWNDSQEKVYSELQDLAAKDEDEEVHVLSLINLLRMVCDVPSMILDSAAHREAFLADLEVWEDSGDPGVSQPRPRGSEAALRLVKALKARVSDKHHAKLEVLHGLLTEVHPDEKVVIFSSWNEALLPTLSARLDEWRVGHVVYTGSENQKQRAQDSFQTDPSVRVFLSSDAGSDSIDLDAGSVVIHFDQPWKWSTLVQRQNRIHRATSNFSTVRFYTLIMANSVEERMSDIIRRKQAYHDQVFGSGVGDIGGSARLTRDDLLYILTGS